MYTYITYTYIQAADISYTYRLQVSHTQTSCTRKTVDSSPIHGVSMTSLVAKLQPKNEAGGVTHCVKGEDHTHNTKICGIFMECSSTNA